MSNALKISEACSLAIHAMTLMAIEPGRHFTTHDVAKTLNASEAHLSKVMQRLAKAELVRSVRGPHGGFELVRPPKETALITIYEVIEGPFVPNRCLLKKPVCQGHKCVLGGLIESINDRLRQYLEGTTLADLTDVCTQPQGESHDRQERHN